MSRQLTLFGENSEPIPSGLGQNRYIGGRNGQHTSLLRNEIQRLMTDESFLEEDALVVAQEYVDLVEPKTTSNLSKFIPPSVDQPDSSKTKPSQQNPTENIASPDDNIMGADPDQKDSYPRIQVSSDPTGEHGLEIDGYLSDLTSDEIGKLIRQYHMDASKLTESVADIIKPIHKIRFNRSQDTVFKELFENAKPTLPGNIQEYLINEKILDDQVHKGTSVREDLGNTPKDD